MSTSERTIGNIAELRAIVGAPPSSSLARSPTG